MSGNNGGWDSPPMPRDPKGRLPRDPGTRPQTPWLNSFAVGQRRYMHWYLDQQVVIVQKLFYQHFKDWRLKLQLNIAMLRVQDVLAHPDDPAYGQPQQVLTSYTTSEARLLCQYAQQQASDSGDQLYKRYRTRRSVEDINKALLELRMWQINEHKPAPEEPPKGHDGSQRPNLQDLRVMLAASRLPDAQRQAAWRSAIADSERHEAWLKWCFQASQVTASRGAAASQAYTAAPAAADNGTDSEESSSEDEDESENVYRTARPMQPPVQPSNAGATRFDDDIRRWSAATHVDAAQREAMLVRLHSARRLTLSQAAPEQQAGELRRAADAQQPSLGRRHQTNQDESEESSGADDDDESDDDDDDE